MNMDLFVVQGTQTKAGLWAPLMEDVFAAAQEPKRMLKNSKLSSSSEIFWLWYLHTIASFSFPLLWLTILIVTNSFFILKITTVRYSGPSLMLRLSISEHKTEQCFGNGAKAPRLVGYALVHGSKCSQPPGTANVEAEFLLTTIHGPTSLTVRCCFQKEGTGTC